MFRVADRQLPAGHGDLAVEVRGLRTAPLQDSNTHLRRRYDVIWFEIEVVVVDVLSVSDCDCQGLLTHREAGLGRGARRRGRADWRSGRHADRRRSTRPEVRPRTIDRRRARTVICTVGGSRRS